MRERDKERQRYKEEDWKTSGRQKANSWMRERDIEREGRKVERTSSSEQAGIKT